MIGSIRTTLFCALHTQKSLKERLLLYELYRYHLGFGKPYWNLEEWQATLNCNKAAMAASLETVAPVTVPVEAAFELLKEGYRYLDVRTQEEFVKGHVEAAVNIPYMFKEETGYPPQSKPLISGYPPQSESCKLMSGTSMTKNVNFVEEVSKQFNKDENFIVGCQSGGRSLRAVNDLIAVGFKGTKDMGGGFRAWIQSGYKICSDQESHGSEIEHPKCEV